MKRQLNFKFLGLLVLVVGAVAVGGHFLHAHQVKRNAGYLLKQSHEAVAKKEYSNALRYLAHYLTLRPDDAVARARYGVMHAQQAKSSKAKTQAFLTLERAFRDDPDLDQKLRESPELQEDARGEDKENAAIAKDQMSARRRAALLAMDLYQFQDAKVHLDILLKANPRDGELLVVLGRCDEDRGRYADAVRSYSAAIEADPSRVEAYQLKAALLRREPKSGEIPGQAKTPTPEDVVQAMIAANPNSVRARLAAVRHYRLNGNFAAAKENLSAAQSGESVGDKEVLIVAADLALGEEKIPEAREKLERGIKEFPDEAQFYFLLASLELRARNAKRAVAVLQDLQNVLPKESSELWAVADFLIDANERTQARAVLEKLKKEDAGAAEVDFLQARLLLDEGQTIPAERLLLQCRRHFIRQPYLAIRTELLLSLCYERLGKSDEQVKAAQAAVALDQNSVTTRRNLASAFVADGKVEEALRIYRSLIAQEPAVRLVIARLDAAQNRARAVKDRNLALAKEMLSGAPESLTRVLDYHLVRAEVLAAEGTREKLAEARRIVGEGRNRFPKEPQIWILFSQIAAATSAAEAHGQLDMAQAEIGDQVSLRLARAALHLQAARVAGKSLDPALIRTLESQTDKFSESEQFQLHRGLAEVYMGGGSVADGERLLRSMADRRPNDLLLLTRLLEVVTSQSDPAQIEPLKNKLRTTEGEDGTIWRFADALEAWVRYLKDKQPSHANHAMMRLAEVARKRPDWSRAPLLEGEIEDRLGHPDQAIEKYLSAIRLGVRIPGLIQRTAALLTSRGRHDEVRQLIDGALRTSSEVPAELKRLDALNLLSLGEDESLVRKSLEQGAPDSSEDYQVQLFRGALLSELRRPKDAEAAHRKAIALNPKASEVWTSFVSFLVRNDRLPEAKAEIEKAAAALPNEKKAAALGACYDAIGNRPEAEKYYLQAVRDSGENEVVLRSLVTFYVAGGESEKSEPILRKMIASGSSLRPWARRTLAISLAASGDYARGSEALRNLESNLLENPGSSEDLRLRSLILMTRPGERAASIKELEAMLSRNSTPAEEFLLAQLYELDGNWPKAFERFLGVLSGRGGSNPRYLAHFVRSLLRNDDLAGAATWLARLEAHENNNPMRKGKSPLVAELRARLLVKQGRSGQAAELLRTYAEETFKDKNNPVILQTVGMLMSELKLNRDAEVLLRQYVAVAEMKTPASVLVLAEFLARQKRAGEALAICSTALGKVNAELVARMAVGVVRLAEPNAAQIAEAESIVAKAAQNMPESLDIPISMADLRDAQGKYDDAKAMYRKLIEKSSRNTLAMNNLAWLLALQEGNYQEALKFVNQAREIRGPEGNLLDTRAVVLLLAGRAAEAIVDLNAAIAQEPLPERYFHLAQAQMKAGNTVEARRALRKAQELNLSKEINLHRLEWKSYDELMGQIGSK